MGAFSIKIVNDRGDEDQLNLLLTADSSIGLSGITLGVSTKLSDFRRDNPSMTIEADTLVSARLYVGYGTLPAAPVPESNQYYGWIELTKESTDPCVWINLSNVDISGLPLTLEGETVDSKPWSLGYKNSVTDIIAQLKSQAIIDPTCGAIVPCPTGKTKILGPNKMPQCYRSYDDYIDSLAKVSAKLTIVSDTPKGGQPITFTGSFLPASGPNDPIISMSGGGHTFEILKGQFTTDIMYKCDGGTLIYDGKTVPDNRTHDNDPTGDPAEQVITNSTFRIICVGINESYFTPGGANNSANFPYMTPFQNGQGNQYAEIIHQNSNSYGFPYADGNLKVQMKAAPDGLITLTICKDDEAKDYDPDPPVPPVVPTSGDYEFGIGTGSESLGTISIGGCKYKPNDQGAYGGYLPTVTEWTKMIFSGPGTYIWFKCTGDGCVFGQGCFNDPNAPTWLVNPATGHHVLTWGANVSWKPGVPSPSKPSEDC